MKTSESIEGKGNDQNQTIRKPTTFFSWTRHMEGEGKRTGNPTPRTPLVENKTVHVGGRPDSYRSRRGTGGRILKGVK